MRLGVSVVAAAACLAAGAMAQQRLGPERQPYDQVSADYRADVRRVLGEAFGPGVRLRAIVQPSFAIEFAVGLRQDGERTEIFSLQPSRSIWTYQLLAMYRSGHAGVLVVNGIGGSDEGSDETEDEIRRLEEGLPADPGDLPVTRCAVAVDGSVAAALQAAWRRMLEEVSPPDEAIEAGADGTSYQFSMELDGRALSGAAWSPSEGTRPARLARLAEAMRDYCVTREAGRLRALTRLARQLGGRR